MSRKPARRKSAAKRSAKVAAPRARDAARKSPSTERIGTDRRPSTERQTERKEVRQGVQMVVVDEDNEGQRVDNFLLAQLRGVPKSIIYRVVRKGEVRVNKGRVKPDTRLKAGDQVRIPPVIIKEKPTQVEPGARVQGVMEAAVVFENEQMLVVNKP
ncbi:S4 domain-containing protein, partial [Marinobacter alexandrii]